MVSCPGEESNAHNAFSDSNDSNHEGGMAALMASLKLCAENKDLKEGMTLHERITQRGLVQKNPYFGSALVSMYAKCGALEKAKELFDVLPLKNTVTWNALISGYSRQGFGKQSLNCFEQMKLNGLLPNIITFIYVLKACSSTKCVHVGKQIHKEIVARGLLGTDIVLSTALVDMYAKCAALASASQVLHSLPVRNVVSWNTIIGGYAQQGQGVEALKCLKDMKSDGISPDVVSYISILKACGRMGVLDKCKQLHDEIASMSFLGEEAVLGSCLVDAYAKCGAVEKANEVHNQYGRQNIVSWNSMIAGCAKQGQGDEAMKYFDRIQTECLFPDFATLICILNACSSIGAVKKGKQIHTEIEHEGLLTKDIMIGNSLIDMYAKSGVLEQAQKVLEELPVRNVVSWNTLIAGYVLHGQGEAAVDCLDRMEPEGISPNSVTFVSTLKACGSIGAPDKGIEIHNYIASRGLLRNNVFLCNALVDMYVKCGALGKAHEVLEDLSIYDVASWNSLIAGYAIRSQSKEAFKCFKEMQSRGLSPDAITLTCMSTACANSGTFELGEQIHNYIRNKNMLGDNVVLGTALVDMYAKCGVFTKAEKVFDELQIRSVVTWSALIGGFTEHGYGEDAIRCFTQMHIEGLLPDAITLICVLKACGSKEAIKKGQQIHNQILQMGFLESDLMIGSAVVDMYVKCSSPEQALCVLEELPFRDAASWNALIGGYAGMGQGEAAFNCYERMQGEDISPNIITFICMLKACSSLISIQKGKQFHDEIASRNLVGKDIVLDTALIDMYVKCGEFEIAEEVLVQLPVRNVITWNTIITGYVHFGDGERALDCFEKMKSEDISPDSVTFLCILKACGSTGSIDKGEKVHEEIINKGLLGKEAIGNALVDMYAKFGVFAKAEQVIDNIPVRSVVPWNALITGYAQRGHGQKAIECFNRMQEDNAIPDTITFLALLNACSHSGLVYEGENYFLKMTQQYGVIPDLDHHTCMVDLFGRSGLFEKAMTVINRMPSSDYLPVWGALLSACRKWGNIKLGRYAFDQAIRIDSSSSAAYLLMISLYSTAGMREEAEMIETQRVKNTSINVT